MSRFVRGAVAAVFTLSVTASAMASCLIAGGARGDEMSCVRAAHPKCGQMVRTACCRTPAPSSGRFVAVKAAPPVKPLIAANAGRALDLLNPHDATGLLASGRMSLAASPPRAFVPSPLRI
jgi:hypothetical protein